MICASCGYVNRIGELLCNACGDFLPAQSCSRPHDRVSPADSSVLLLATGDRIIRCEVTPECQAIVAINQEGEVSLQANSPEGRANGEAVIYIEAGAAYIQGLGNAAFANLNGLRLISDQPRLLQSADLLCIGDVEIHVYLATGGNGRFLARSRGWQHQKIKAV